MTGTGNNNYKSKPEAIIPIKLDWVYSNENTL